MDKELEAEIHPLKQDDGTPLETSENQMEKDRSFKKVPRYSWCAQCRTIVFFFLLFACLFVVFVISFIIPCVDRPISQRIWTINYDSAVTYDFLSIEDTNNNRVKDIIFLYKDYNSSSLNVSCAEKGFSSPCAFLVAVASSNGSLLWERPVAQEVDYMECPDHQGKNEPPLSCFIVGKDNFLSVDISLGEILWNKTWVRQKATLLSPFLSIPDVTGDGVKDLFLFTQMGNEITAYIFSRSTGDQVGSLSNINLEGKVGYIMHVTNTGAYYIIFHSASSLYGYSLKELYEKMTRRKYIFEEDPHWKEMIDRVTHRLPPSLSSGAIRYLLNVPGNTGNDILVVKSDACELLNGQELISKWTLNASKVIRKPVLGHYKPDALAVVLENGSGVQREILIVDATSGAVLWNHTLAAFAGTPKSISIHTTDQRSAFFFWGSSDQMETVDSQKNLYLFHPMFPDILLELGNITKNIVAFNVLEQNQQASYILLTGPTSKAAPGLMSLLKQKVKENILNARVIRLGQTRPESDRTIKNRFYELRYKREV